MIDTQKDPGGANIPAPANADVAFIESALSFYDCTPSREDIREAWSRVKAMIPATHKTEGESA